MMYRLYFPAVVVIASGALLCVGCGDFERSNTANQRTGAPADGAQPPLGRSESQYPSDGAKTAFDQSERSEHIKMTADIRRAIMNDENLSTGAKNCTVVTDEKGMVTLSGTVSTQAEKSAIEGKARAVAGAGNVTNRLVIRAN